MDRQKLLLLSTATAALCATLGVYLSKRRQRKNEERRMKRTMWSRKWLQRRQGRGTLALLNTELRTEDPDAYKNFLRLDPSQFTILLSLVEDDIKKQDTFMRECISAEHKLNVTLRFLATGETFRSLMYSTRIHESTISKFVPEVCASIYRHLRKKYLAVPTTAEGWCKIAKEYEERWNFPHCIGALDGRHISFSAPISSGSYYHNYKGTNSIILLGLVDAQYKFTYVNVGVNGRVSDGGVFSASMLSKKIRDGSLALPEPQCLPGRTSKVPYVIVADEAFPLLPNVMKPFPQRVLSYENRIFNYRLSRARRLVECGFGILANRWRILLNKIHLSPDKAELITLTCVVLHNFLATENVKYTEGVYDTDFNNTDTLNQIAQQVGNHSSTLSRDIREEFKNYFLSDIGSVPWQDTAVQRGN
ncbi:unnamed protein product [Callosobruchus maculatus]|uniref:DDE Tnp4 domain-containing protein n=1 Tax=Callosobruchus maculatus TaxID=64391 RepID=A0A653D9I7_CALMS|nr:unnamed protein product [Callosobruchus maculatus]